MEDGRGSVVGCWRWNMSRILFLSERDSCRSAMAAAFARVRCGDTCTAISAGLSNAAIHPMTVKVMGELGIDVSSHKPGKLSELQSREFDLVVTLSDKVAEHCPLLPCCPQQVDWNLADPAAITGDEDSVLAEFRNSRDAVRRLVDDLFDRGYLSALLHARHCQGVICDNISDALLVHDLDRSIVFFNPAAEHLTGYSSDEVIGSDCHDTFAGNLCGGKCILPDGPCAIQESSREEINITHKDGSPVNVERCIRPLVNLKDEVVGAVVLFRDRTREQRLAQRVRATQSFAGIIGRDKKMLEIYDLIRDLAQSNIPVLIQGDSGTGKELVAAAMHNEGPRARRLFVPVNCGSLPETLLESELFGHVRGAFTGAIRDKKGRFELADGGTIFLDEIGDVSPAMQVKLLRVLQEGEIVRVGSEETIKVDVRVISATNKNLTEEIAACRFREDLYYRLSVMPIWLPPLRERRNDIPLLAEHILGGLRSESSRGEMVISPEAMDMMVSYDWPGNVRELQNWLQFAMVKCKGKSIRPEHLPSPGRSVPAARKVSRRPRLDNESVRLALQQTNGNKKMAAGILGVSRATLYRFLDKEKNNPG